MQTTGLRSYYDARYHYAEDVERPNESRLWSSMNGLQPLRGSRFLDVGCGVGWSSELATRRGEVGRAIGVDFSWTAIAAAKRRDPGGAWIQGDGVALPFAAGAFDRAFSFGSIEHFPDVAKGFAELRRVMRLGGLAVVVVPNFWVRTDQPHEHRATARGWRAIIEPAGFEVLRIGSDRGPALFKNRRPLRILMRVALRLLTYVPPLRYQHVFLLRAR